jgi:hypothetical protein
MNLIYRYLNSGRIKMVRRYEKRLGDHLRDVSSNAVVVESMIWFKSLEPWQCLDIHSERVLCCGSSDSSQIRYDELRKSHERCVRLLL